MLNDKIKYYKNLQETRRKKFKGMLRCFVCTTQTSLEPNLSPDFKQIRIYRVDVEH